MHKFLQFRQNLLLLRHLRLFCREYRILQTLLLHRFLDFLRLFLIQKDTLHLHVLLYLLCIHRKVLRVLFHFQQCQEIFVKFARTPLFLQLLQRMYTCFCLGFSGKRVNQVLFCFCSSNVFHIIYISFLSCIFRVEIFIFSNTLSFRKQIFLL